jgi:hypothetical protein
VFSGRESPWAEACGLERGATLEDSSRANKQPLDALATAASEYWEGLGAEPGSRIAGRDASHALQFAVDSAGQFTPREGCLAQEAISAAR